MNAVMNKILAAAVLGGAPISGSLLGAGLIG